MIHGGTFNFYIRELSSSETKKEKIKQLIELNICQYLNRTNCAVHSPRFFCTVHGGVGLSRSFVMISSKLLDVATSNGTIIVPMV